MTTATLEVSAPIVAFREAVAAIPDADLLIFGSGNAKLDPAIDHFSLPAGWSCPGARDCLARAVEREEGWRIEDGPNSMFRCFAASEEVRYANVRQGRWHNLDKLREYAGDGDHESQVEGMARLILASLPLRERVFDLFIDGRAYKQVVRVHVAGDFFSQAYFDAWLTVARKRPDVLFYGYTKSLPFWVRRLGVIPSNFVLTASYGGRWDHLIEECGLRSARVVFSEAEAADLGLEIDEDDSHAMRRGPGFSLLLHGTQKARTPAAKAWLAIQAGGGGHGKASRERAKRNRKARVSLPVLAS